MRTRRSLDFSGRRQISSYFVFGAMYLNAFIALIVRGSLRRECIRSSAAVDVL